MSKNGSIWTSQNETMSQDVPKMFDLIVLFLAINSYLTVNSISISYFCILSPSYYLLLSCYSTCAILFYRVRNISLYLILSDIMDSFGLCLTISDYVCQCQHMTDCVGLCLNLTIFYFISDNI